MRVNLAFWDRSLRFVFGIFLFAWAIAGGPWWGYIGLYLITTSSWGVCPLYALLKIRTAPAEERPLVPPE